jgi:hypothetical protein
MIYILIPNEIDDFFQIRVFDSFSVVEQIAKQEAQKRVHPNWCRIFAYALGLDEYAPCWVFTVTSTFDMKREPIRSP